MKEYKFHVVIEKGENGWFVASVPNLHGCYTQGRTRKQALERIHEVIELCIEELKEQGMPIPQEESQEVRVVA